MKCTRFPNYFFIEITDREVKFCVGVLNSILLPENLSSIQKHFKIHCRGRKAEASLIFPQTASMDGRFSIFTARSSNIFFSTGKCVCHFVSFET